jgi:hypothetical protein
MLELIPEDLLLILYWCHINSHRGVVCLCPCYDICSSFLSICQDLSPFGSTFHKTMFNRQTTVQFFSIKLGRTWSDQAVEEFPISQETGE